MYLSSCRVCVCLNVSDQLALSCRVSLMSLFPSIICEILMHNSQGSTGPWTHLDNLDNSRGATQCD